MRSAIRNEGSVDKTRHKINKWFFIFPLTLLSSGQHTTYLSTGPPRPRTPAGQVSWLLLVSDSREKGSKNKRESADVKKSNSSVLLSVAAKLRVVAERDLRKGQGRVLMGLKHRQKQVKGSLVIINTIKVCSAMLSHK